MPASPSMYCCLLMRPLTSFSASWMDNVICSRTLVSSFCSSATYNIHTSLLHHSSLQAQNLPFQHILPTWTAFMIMAVDQTYHACRFITSDKGGGKCVHLRLSVCQDYSKTHAWIWIKCCMSLAYLLVLPGSRARIVRWFDVEDATTLSWSSAAVSE